MGIRLFNTASGRKEEFQPRDPGKVGMYVCGVTVYDFCHLGHARGAVLFDVIRRYFEYSGYAVTYVRNFTDVDDKIIQRAAEAGVPWNELAERFIREYRTDMANLGVRAASIEPKATEHIDDILDMVKRLVEKGHAYEIDGDVFFRIDSFPRYGRLSGRDLEELRAGARVEVDARKENPLDFAVWKRSKPGEPWWESPWGPGRPGWHIECSAMSSRHLGDGFDIHGGGKDLVFPHHENEIAQSEACSGRPFVRFWMHNGFVNVDREKMSKSLGNFFTIREILDRYDAEAVRLFLLSTHYRSPIDFSDKNLEDTVRSLGRFYRVVEEAGRFLEEARAQDASGEGAPELSAEVEGLASAFREAMDDDFNTAQAVGEIFRVSSLVGAAVREPGNRGADVARAAEVFLSELKRMAGVLGIFESGPEEWRRRQEERSLKLREDFPVEEIESLIEERNRCRENKDWAGADAIRDRLGERGIALEDGPQGTTWRLETRSEG